MLILNHKLANKNVIIVILPVKILKKLTEHLQKKNINYVIICSSQIKKSNFEMLGSSIYREASVSM